MPLMFLRVRVTLLILAVAICTPAMAWAQLAAPNKSGVAMGHLHYHVRDVEANKRFWTALGGQGIRIGNTEVMKFPGVLVFLSSGAPSGGTEGSVLNHVAFRVPSLSTVETAGLAVQPVAGFPGVASVLTPDGERIELFEDAAQNLTFTQDAGYNDVIAERHNRPVPTPVAFHHIHLYVPDGSIPEVKAWYVRVFGGTPGKRSQYDAVDLPGMNLNISSPNPSRGSAPTKGRILDHIGMEITGLEAFCKRLASMGVKFDVAYTRDAAGFAKAVLTDPWGTSVELTEGLRDFR
jgi:catechol 2,3-dioxygenase-like lactoylglutathione lyase family enzyme